MWTGCRWGRGSENLSCFLEKLCTGAKSSLNDKQFLGKSIHFDKSICFLKINKFSKINIFLKKIPQRDRCWTWCFSSEKVKHVKKTCKKRSNMSTCQHVKKTCKHVKHVKEWKKFQSRIQLYSIGIYVGLT